MRKATCRWWYLLAPGTVRLAGFTAWEALKEDTEFEDTMRHGLTCENQRGPLPSWLSCHACHSYPAWTPPRCFESPADVPLAGDTAPAGPCLTATGERGRRYSLVEKPPQEETHPCTPWPYLAGEILQGGLRCRRHGEHLAKITGPKTCAGVGVACCLGVWRGERLSLSPAIRDTSGYIVDFHWLLLL